MCHVAWMIWVYDGVSLGSFRCAWDAGSASVAAKVKIALTYLVVGRVFSPLCSFACTAATLSMCICGCSCGVVRFSNNCVQSLAPSFHGGGTYFNSMSAYLRGWHWFRSYLA
jgi:hypothetical protein